MKKSLRFVAIGGILALSIPAFLAFSQNTKSVDAYSTSSLPTTIDLNDTSAANIRSYYSSLNNLSTSERQGNNLLKNLKTILKNGQKYYSYDSGNAIWQIYEIADRDWSKSPASSTTYGTYNSSTNKITNYTYGTSSSSSKNNPYIHALYINRNVDNQVTAWDDHQQTQWGINREHVWPKAEGFETTGAGGARGDPMHLMAGNGYANNIHSNYYYGYVNTSSSYTNCGSKYSNVSGNLLGKSKTLGGSTNVFEPQDCDKGDIARAIFYMVARYNYLSGSDSDGIDSNNPNLALTQSLSDWASSGYASTTSTKGYMGIMTDLLAWHHADPVDEYEIHRNNLLYTNYTNNRNPFIDFPEWANFIWGSVNYNGSTYVSNSTTPTGYAAPSSDTINGYNSGGGEVIAVTGVSLNTDSTSVEAGKDVTLTATVAPSNATNQTVTWTSSDSSIATVSGGIVTGVAEGSATITVITSDGGYTDTCSVEVTSSGGGGGGESIIDEWDVSTFDSAPSSYTTDGTEYSKTGPVTSVNYYGTGLTSSGNIRGNKTASTGNFNLRNSTTKSDYYVSKVAITETGGTMDPLTSNRSVLIVGSSVFPKITSETVPTGTQITANETTAGTSLTFENKDTSVSYFQFYSLKTSGTCTSGHIQVYWTPVSSSSKALDSISLDTSDAQTIFNVGDTFSYEGLSVTANYDDGTDDIVTPSSVSVPDMSTAGQKTVTVTYTEDNVTETATYTITVNAVTLTFIEVSNAKTAYYVGDTFVKPTVTATYSNGSTSDVTNSATFSGYNLSNAGNQTVTVSYTNGGTTKTTSYSITVTAVTITSITISGYTTLFNVGDTFSFGGTVTANYNNGSTADVTASASFSGYNMSTAGNQTVTVSYGGQSTTYQITVSESSGATDTTQYSLITSTSDLEVGKSYILTNGTSGTVKAAAVTSNTNNRKATSATISSNKITRGSSILSFTLGGSSGAWTFKTENYAGTDGYLASGDSSSSNANHLKVISTAGTATISFSDSAATINIGPHGSRTLICFNSGIDSNNGGFACYSAQGSYGLVYLWKEVSTKTLSSISLDTTNVQKTFSVGATFNYTGLVVTAHYSDSSSATVTPTSVSSPDMSSAGNKTVTVTYTENGTSKTATYSITVSSNPTISWDAPTINVYSGSTLSGSDVNSWNVTYNDGAGHTTTPTYSQVSVKLDGSTISIPYTWNANDDGKTLCVSYNSLTTATTTVQITQTINAVNKIIPAGSETSDLTFTGSCGGSGTANDGKTWAITSDAAESAYDSTKGVHYGTGSASVEYIQLTSSSFTSGTITQVVVNASGAKDVTGSVSVTVGGNQFGEIQSFDSTASNKTFTGSASAGQIVVRIYKAAAAVKAIYCKSVEVTYSTPESSQNIANSLDHIEAQRVAVKFAKAFNAAMDTTNGCTTNLSSAWSTCSSAYNTFKSEAAALGSTEEAYAKDLIKYATVQYSDDSGEACVERMMKTYEVCVQKHGQTAFMSDLVTLERASNTNPITIIGNKTDTNTIMIVVIASVLSLTAIAGYIFLRKRKEL